jgi:hypothetical protein
MTVPTVETPARFSGSPDHFGDRVIVCVPITLGPRRIRRACFEAPQIFAAEIPERSFGHRLLKLPRNYRAAPLGNEMRKQPQLAAEL